MILPLLLSLAPTGADSLLLRVGADRDNTLYETTDGSLSNGSGEHLFAGTTNGGSRRRTLVHFDLSAIPAGARIRSVRLTLNISKEPVLPPPVTYKVHRLLGDWGEGSSDAPGEEGGGAPSAPDDATWLHRFYPNLFWTTPGGDFQSTPSASEIAFGGLGPITWESHGLVLDVQGWVDGSLPNYGWLIRTTQESTTGTAKRFDTREFNGAAQNRPRLEIEYELGTPPCNLTPLCQGNAADLSIDTCRCDAPAIQLTLSGAPPGAATYLLVGRGSAPLTFPGGDLCLGGAPIGRYLADAGVVDATGTFTTDVLGGSTGAGSGTLPDGLGSLCAPAGESFTFQYWHRDQGGSAFSKGLRVSLR